MRSPGSGDLAKRNTEPCSPARLGILVYRGYLAERRAARQSLSDRFEAIAIQADIVHSETIPSTVEGTIDEVGGKPRETESRAFVNDPLAIFVCLVAIGSNRSITESISAAVAAKNGTEKDATGYPLSVTPFFLFFLTWSSSLSSSSSLSLSETRSPI
ncbi:hypothetical protein HN011_010274 [Eciton burchellii]|nr:hypothetical protein HN011_010274 [Eciton burchellii]